MAVPGVVAGHELVEVQAFERLGLEGVVDVRAVVEDPKLLGPRLLTGGLGVEKQDVCLDALGVEDAGGEPQQGVNVRLLQQLPPHGLARSSLEQHVVGDDDRATAVDLEQALDVLEEVQLLVLGRCPEVGPLVRLVLLFQVALFVHDGDGRFLPEWRIGQEQAHAIAVSGRAGETILARDDGAGVGVDPVEHEVHDAEPGGVRDEFPASHETPLQVLLLVGVEVFALVTHHVVMSGQEKAPRAASGVAERVCRCRPVQSTIALMSSRGVKY